MQIEERSAGDVTILDLKGKITLDARFDEPLPEDELGGWNLA